MSTAGLDLNNIPAGVPPAGVTSNLINPPSLQITMIVVWSVLIGITLPVVSCRLFYNYHSTRKLGPDDWSAVAATILSLCHTGIILAFSRTARHQWDIPLAWFNVTYFKEVFVQQLISCLAIYASKISILLLYRRIFKVKDWMNYAIYAGLIWGFIAYVPFIALASVFCAPHIGEEWDFTTAERCSKPIIWDITAGVMGLILDIYIFILPLPLISKLQLSRRKFIGVLLVFLTAAMAIICASLTIVFYIRVMKITSDGTWATSQLLIVRGVENYISILVSCAPGVSSFFRAYIKESKIYNSIVESLLSRRRRSKESGLPTYTKSASHIGLETVGGTPYRKSNSRGVQHESTTYLHQPSELD